MQGRRKPRSHVNGACEQVLPVLWLAEIILVAPNFHALALNTLRKAGNARPHGLLSLMLLLLL